MDNKESENSIPKDSVQTPVKDDNIMNNNATISNDDNVFVESKKHLNFNDASQTGVYSPNLNSPSRQQVIGDVINEVISDHLDGDHPVPRLVPLDTEDEDERTGHEHSQSSGLRTVSSEKEVTNAGKSTDNENASNENIVQVNGLEEIKSQESQITNGHENIEKKDIVEEISTMDNSVTETNAITESLNTGSLKTNEINEDKEEDTPSPVITNIPKSGGDVSNDGKDSDKKPVTEAPMDVKETEQVVESSNKPAANSQSLPTAEQMGGSETAVSQIANTSDELSLNVGKNMDNIRMETVPAPSAENTPETPGESLNVVTDKDSASESNEKVQSNEKDASNETEPTPSAGNEEGMETKKKDAEWLDILGNGLLKKKVGKLNLR